MTVFQILARGYVGLGSRVVSHRRSFSGEAPDIVFAKESARKVMQLVRSTILVGVDGTETYLMHQWVLLFVFPQLRTAYLNSSFTA